MHASWYRALFILDPSSRSPTRQSPASLCRPCACAFQSPDFIRLGALIRLNPCKENGKQPLGLLVPKHRLPGRLSSSHDYPQRSLIRIISSSRPISLRIATSGILSCLRRYGVNRVVWSTCGHKVHISILPVGEWLLSGYAQRKHLYTNAVQHDCCIS